MKSMYRFHVAFLHLFPLHKAICFTQSVEAQIKYIGKTLARHYKRTQSPCPFLEISSRSFAVENSVGRTCFPKYHTFQQMAPFRFVYCCHLCWAYAVVVVAVIFAAAEFVCNGTF